VGFFNFLVRKQPAANQNKAANEAPSEARPSIVRPVVYRLFEEKLQEAESGAAHLNLETLAEAYLYWICHFCDPDAAKKSANARPETMVADRYTGDSTIFEWGAYLIFRADLWHFANKREKERDIVIPLLIEKFLTCFEEAFKANRVEPIETVLMNRLRFYAKSTVNQITLKGMHFHVKQLIQYSSSESTPKTYDIEHLPVLIGDVFESFQLDVYIASAETHVVPGMLEMFKNTYDHLEGQN
jgi:hypothetical protein